MAKVKRGHELAAGIFVALSLAAVFVVLMLVSDFSGFFESKQTYKVIFTVDQNIEGLKSGAAVKLGGFRVGNVTNVRPEALRGPNGDQWRMLVEISIPKKYVLHKDGLVIELARPLVGSDATLNIADIGTGELRKPEDTIEGQIASAPFLTDALRKLGIDENEAEVISKLVADLGKSGERIRMLLEQKGEVGQIISNINAASDKLTQFMGNADATAASIRGMVAKDGVVMQIAQKIDKAAQNAVDILEENRQNIKDMIANTAKTTEGTAEIQRKLRDALGPLLTKVDNALATANEALAGFRNLAAAAEEMVKRNQVPVGAMVDDYRIMAGNLKATSAEIRANPWRLLYQPTDNDKRKAVLNDAARNFATGAGQVHNASQILSAAVTAGGDKSLSDAPEVKAALKVLRNSIANFRKVEHFLLKETAEK